MCRLFGLHAGGRPVTASFWLIDAPDSLRRQSRHNPDGAGIGVFDAAGEPLLDKQPIAAYTDEEFIREARTARSRTFVAHVRYASVGAHTVATRTRSPRTAASSRTTAPSRGWTRSMIGCSNWVPRAWCWATPTANGCSR